tara:strand:- start:555 stop:1457 length:903 start_codon:yes stop_codon:yes gene_type:complete
LKITAIILTKDEELHIERCICSIKNFVDEVLVVDSGSSDETRNIAERHGAIIYEQPWRNYSQQFNYALSLVNEDCTWVLRIDADETLEPFNVDLIRNKLEVAHQSGFLVVRYINFLNKKITHGGASPINTVRLFKPSVSHCEKRWMDEHIVTEGEIGTLPLSVVDQNLKPLSWWIDKHNGYASREAVDVLLAKYLPKRNKIEENHLFGQAKFKRFVKENIYNKLPLGWRSFLYFLYRFVIRGGFRDGRKGAAFHLLQGFWYRYLVDLKVQEIEELVEAGYSIEKAIESATNIKLTEFEIS